MMPAEDKAVIEAFAAGDTSLRNQAVEAYRRNLPAAGAESGLHQRFMAEIDTNNPDLGLRSQLRRELLQSISPQEPPPASPGF